MIKNMKIRVKRFDKSLPLPSADSKAAGIDLICSEDVVVSPQSVGLIKINLAVEVPEGYFLLITVRSSTPLKKGLILANGIGVVDPFYSGDKDEIKVQLLNFTNANVEIRKGELLTQALLVKNEVIDWDEVESFGHEGHGGYWA